jgi:4-amino-4-deoxy-L-arabinose transferase-like glycosyltransferase
MIVADGQESRSPTPTVERSRGRPGVWLALILALAAVLRLHNLTAPIADNLQAKQAYSANKARNIARAPFDPLRRTLDLLDGQGRPMELVEEVPLYIGLLGGAYALFGEHAAWGRLLSILGSLVAIAAFYDLARREHGARAARIAALLLAIAPLSVFYGRAVLPDPWMLAMMLACAACYRRYLDGEGRVWLFAASVCGLLAVAFKYWGLMIVVVLADMARRRWGTWRALGRPSFVALMAALVVPTALWMALVFARAPNPVWTGWVAGEPASPYLVAQQPSALGNRQLYAALVTRFLIRDCGPFAGVLFAAGAWAALRRRVPDGFRFGSLGAWTFMGLFFYFLFAPKTIDHDYYELMMLPPALTWAALGWMALGRSVGWIALRSIHPTGWRALAVLVLGLAVVVQSPWIMGGMFRVERGKVALGERLGAACSPTGRVVSIGPGIAHVVVVHESRRAGWTLRARALPDDWPARLAQLHALGAEVVGVYFDAKTTPAERAAYEPMLRALPVVEHRVGPGRRPAFEYTVLRLGDAEGRRLAAMADAALRR